MTAIESQVVTTGEEFASNHQHMSGMLKAVEDIFTNMRNKELGYKERAEKKNKLLPRERLALLLDPGSPFLEICPLGGFKMYGDEDGSTAGGNIICGIGYVSGRRCMVVVWNFAIKGGTINAVTTKKMLRVQRIVFEQKLPLISLSESGGGNLADPGAGMDPWGAANFIDGGVCYCQQAELSAAGIPQIVVAHGNATAGGAYHVALCDYIVLVKSQTQLFLAGPPLLKAATGEVATAEELGGAEMHAEVSGTGEYLAEDDEDGIRIARQVVSQLPADQVVSETSFTEPLYSPEELIGIVPSDKRVPYDVREIIARIADGSEFFEFSAAIDQQTICGHLSIMGFRCGVIGNNGPITPKGALKVAQFIQLCEQSDIPVIFLHNTTGFLVGVEVEQIGQVKHGSKMVQAVANMKVPKISMIVGNSYGAGNYAMASRALKPDFVFAWPTARQAVMGGAQAAKVMSIVAEEKLANAGMPLDDNIQAQLDEQGKKIEGSLEAISEALYCSARLMDDGIIDPRDTRRVLGLTLEVCKEGRSRNPTHNGFGIPRF